MEKRRDRDRWGKKEEEERWKNSESQSKGREAKERLRWWKPSLLGLCLLDT